MVKKHIKPGPANPQGGIECLGSRHSHFQCDGRGRRWHMPPELGRRRGDDGKLVRYSKKTNEELK